MKTAWHVLLVGLAACGAETRRSDDVLAQVNGVPIRRAEVEWRAAHEGHGAAQALTAEMERNLLEAIIGEELLAQQAVAQGLDRDPQVQARLLELEAQRNAARRRALSELAARQALGSAAAPSDTEVRRYYDEHVDDMRTEVRVWRILRKSESAIGEAQAALLAGEPFEKVALADLPAMPEGTRPPYDMGWLSLEQLPQAWRDTVLALRPGQTSDILRGEGGRFWILSLVERRDNPGVTFESSRSALSQRLLARAREQRRDGLAAELRSAAHVDYGPALNGGR